jgi:hypothetical protein
MRKVETFVVRKCPLLVLKEELEDVFLWNLKRFVRRVGRHLYADSIASLHFFAVSSLNR